MKSVKSQGELPASGFGFFFSAFFSGFELETEEAAERSGGIRKEGGQFASVIGLEGS